MMMQKRLTLRSLRRREDDVSECEDVIPDGATVCVCLCALSTGQREKKKSQKMAVRGVVVVVVVIVVAILFRFDPSDGLKKLIIFY